MYRLTKTLVLLLFVLIPGINILAQNNSTGNLQSHKSFSPQELLEDFKVLFRTLYEVHPDLYRVNSRQEVAKALEEFGSTLHKERTYLEFLKGVAVVLNKIGCINTQWEHSPDYIEFRNENIPLFPLKLAIDDSIVYVVGSHFSENPIEVGSRIETINGESVRTYIKKNYTLLPMDGQIKTAPKKWLETYFPYHHSNFWEQPSTFTLEIEKPDMSYDTVEVPALLKKDWKEKKPGEQNELLKLQIQDDVAYITIRSFKTARIKQSGKDFDQFLKNSFRKIKESKISTLGIYLFENGWGDIENGAKLMRYLTDTSFTYIDSIVPAKFKTLSHAEHITKYPSDISTSVLELTNPLKPQKNNFKGKLVLFVDGWCVESKAFFLSRINSEREVIVIGEESGGTTFGFNGKPLTVKLPNTGISISIPTVQFVTDMQAYDAIDGVKSQDPEVLLPSEYQQLKK